ncbi:RNA-binding protein [Thermopolyspora flexuosa]|uniref:TROVE domain-containing protein n=1 Tax=Thermopolyspora flexuosa TaxID=103836 RepID=A0A543IYY6_9ACTN|nr:TROVE domain-containing protein [Thermopolyspora flexuosa]TQM75792.1 TROVE domain-containing protein [Thermopolyspora flexuosa]GGM62034.1 RNA-binding protein [Thermopolyspora flexuosa]
MAKFNKVGTKASVSSPVRTERVPSGRTHEGAPGYARDAKSELFLLAVSNMVGEDTFYERAHHRDARFRDLVHQVAVEDVEWLAGFLPWLRTEANMRSAPIVAALEAVAARLALGLHGGNRRLVASVLQRADEPGEALAYWTANHGRAVPKPVKRGIADAVRRLYNERSLLKYDGDTRAFRFADVIELTHPAPAPDKPWQGDLFAHALDRRHERDKPIPRSLRVLRERAELMALPVAERRAALADVDRLARAGITWEALAGWLQGPLDAEAWCAVIPSMGYMALLRNLRNFDQAGVPDEVAERVAAKLADPGEVARSRQLPFRFLTAYRNAPSLRWGHALDRALRLATGNIPAFGGRTLVLVDTSASMSCGAVSARSSVRPVEAAALFGVALAARGANVDLYGFADDVFEHGVVRGGSVLKQVDEFCRRIGEVGHGTRIADALRRTYRGHDRVVVFTDMQTMTGHHGLEVTDAVPAHVPLYGFNLVGYKHAMMPTGARNRHEIGGFSDATFRLIPLLEAGENARWPWL